MKPERCDRCNRGFQKTPILNYCRVCFLNLCPACIRSGCCGHEPARVGDPGNIALGDHQADPGHYVGDGSQPQKSTPSFRSAHRGGIVRGRS